MLRFVLAFMITLIVTFGSVWAGTAAFHNWFVDPEAGIISAHAEMLEKCDIGDILMLGDSTVNADYLPGEIGPNVRTLALGGSSPLENYYILKAALRCAHKPQAVILAFTPFTIGEISNDANTFWGRGVGLHALSWRDIENARATLRRFNDQKFFGSPSIFDIDAHLKTFLYYEYFPSYYFASFKNTKKRRAILFSSLKNETLEDHGHHFYGQDAEIKDMDRETELKDYNIPSISDFYFRKILGDLQNQNIKVYFSYSARNTASITHYNPKVISIYNNWIHNLEHSDKLILIENNIYTLPPQAFGDPLHLNAHGGFWQSVTTRHGMAAHGAKSLVYTDDALKPHNLYDDYSISLGNWHQARPDEASDQPQVSDIIPPTLAYPMPHAQVMHYVGTNKIHYRSKIPLMANTNYILSIFIKNDETKFITLKTLFDDNYSSSVSWDFSTKKILRGGKANFHNSGVELCSGGWIRLWLRNKTLNAPINYQEAFLEMSNVGTDAIYAYGPSLEQEFNSRNDCIMEPTAN